MSTLNFWVHPGQIEPRATSFRFKITTSLLAATLCALLSIAAPARAQDRSTDSVIATPSFSLHAASLKRGTKGVDFDKLFTAIMKTKPAPKSDFETNAEFEARVLKWNDRKLLPNVGADSLLAFIESALLLSLISSDTVGLRYDSETEIMTVNLESGVECGGVMLGKHQKSRGTHIATNSLGAKVKVLLLEETSDCIEFAETGNVKTATQSFTFSVPRKTAELTRNAMKLMIIGTLTSPYAEVLHLRERASMQNPIETHMFRRALSLAVNSIWLVDSLTGTVFAKRDGL